MQERRTRRPRRSIGNGRVRALLSLGMLLGITQVGTLAAWTDSAVVETGSFSTGTLDLRVGENTADQLGGQGGTWQHSSLNLADLAPGESVAQRLTVGNGGSIPLTYTGGISTANEALSGPDGLHLTVVQDATDVSNTGSQDANNRVGTCEGGSATAVTDAPVGSSVTAIHDAPLALGSGATTSYCVVAALSPDAPNAMQGTSTTVVLTFEAEQ